MNPKWWGRKVIQLPSEGTLLVCTDLHGNFEDYLALKALYQREEEAKHQPFLLFCGDLVHGPSPDLNEAGAWPSYLGTAYVDRSVELLLDYIDFAQHARTACLLGNHEHAHIGGPVLCKFYEDEATVLNQSLGEDSQRAHQFMHTFPLIATTACGVCFTHAAPAAAAQSPEQYEELDYDGYQHISLQEMYRYDLLSTLLWSRSATNAQAKHFVQSLEQPHNVVVYGHDIVREGYEKVGDHQVCLSTSYGVHNTNKYYLRLDLSGDYRDVHALREGTELLLLYPDASHTPH